MSRRLHALLLLLAFSPAFLGAVLTARFATDVPIWDDLERATLLQQWQQGELDWGYVYSPHIDHRMGVPRLITLASASLGRGDLVAEQFVIFVIVVATAGLVFGLLRQTFPDRPLRVYGLGFLANVLLFSPLQWETFLYGIQTSFVMPPFALCLALFALGSRFGAVAKFALCFLAAVLASNSFSHGVLLWGVVFAAVALRQGFATPRVRAAFLAVWAIAATAVLVPHFGYEYANTSDFAYVGKGERPPGLQLGTLPQRAERAVLFAAAILGSPLARTTVVDSRDWVPYAAAALLGLFGFAAAWSLWRFREAERWDRWLPWLAMGGYAAVTCITVGLGRSALNKWSYGLVPHYLTVSTYLLLANVVLVSLLASEAAKARAAWLRAGVPTAAAVAAGALLGFQVLQWGLGAAGMAEWHSHRLQARTAMRYLELFEPVHVRRVGAELDTPTPLIRRLDDIGYFQPPLIKDTRLCHFEIAAEPLTPEAARVVGARRVGGSLVLSGHATLPEAGRRADGVLVTARDAEGGFRVVGVGELSGIPEVALAEADYRTPGVRLPGIAEFAGFRTKLPVAGLAGRRLQVWAVDSARSRVQRLAQQVVLEEGPGGPRPRLEADPSRVDPAPAGCPGSPAPS